MPSRAATFPPSTRPERIKQAACSRTSRLAYRTRHAQKSAEADPAAAHRFAVERIVGKPRQETRDRDRAFEPRQRHPGALMRAGTEGEMPVRRAADMEIFRLRELPGVAVGGSDA